MNIFHLYTIWATFILIVAGIYIVAFKFLNLYFPDWVINFSGVITVMVAFVLTLVYMYYPRKNILGDGK